MKRAKVFKNGRSQAIRLPKECQVSGKEVMVKKIGDVLMIFPEQDPWRIVLEGINMFSEDFILDRRDGPPQKREVLFD